MPPMTFVTIVQRQSFGRSNHEQFSIGTHGCDGRARHGNRFGTWSESIAGCQSG